MVGLPLLVTPLALSSTSFVAALAAASSQLYRVLSKYSTFRLVLPGVVVTDTANAVAGNRESSIPSVSTKERTHLANLDFIMFSS